MNSTFRARWLASTEVISQVLFTSEKQKKKQNGFFWYIITNKVTLWFASYSACVVYTKTIIHLSFGESGGYLPGRLAAPLIHHYSPPLRWRIVNYAPTYEAEEEDKSTWPVWARYEQLQLRIQGAWTQETWKQRLELTIRTVTEPWLWWDQMVCALLTQQQLCNWRYNLPKQEHS